MKTFAALLVLSALTMPIDIASAAQATGSFEVRIVIGAACVVTSATDMNFGNVGVLSANIDQTSTINIQCTSGQAYNIGLNRGVTGASVAARQMSAAGSTINYSLSTDAARTINWGETIGTDTVAGLGNGAVQSYTVYGRVPPQTTPAPGTYTDTVTVTITY